ncbi:hypothetical protein [Chitinophaga sancti]|uniref:hypothetical protein n=1 Tax=Chitinophaga sancti TaxID=1004 RepID=UPI003F7A8064
MVKKFVYFVLIQAFAILSLNAQTLQDVTKNGSVTTTGITAASFEAIAPSFFGSSIPGNINLLKGLTINGTMANESQNAITYQSGGGGGAAIVFSRGGSYETRMDFFTNNQPSSGNIIPRLRIGDSGNIGVGTLQPKAALDIGTFINDQKLGIVLGRLSEGNSEGEGTFLGVRGYNTQGSGDIKSFAIEHSFYGEQNSSINFYRGDAKAGGFLGFNTGDNTEKMRITAGGNVGIGISAPGEKLSVNGKIRAKAIKVEINNWPDYVFSPEYTKPSLPELETFITSHGHLPDIPSATEAKENGVDLGDVQAKLLKKIEELTLYLIEKDKELKLQKEQNDYQKGQMELLLKRVEKLEEEKD